MTEQFRRITLGVGAAVLAVGTAAALYASSQDTADGPRSFMGRRGPFARRTNKRCACECAKRAV